MTKRYYLCAVREKTNSSMGGRSVITRYRADFTNQRGELIAIERFRYVRVEREAAKKYGNYANVRPAQWTEEQTAAIDAAYARNSLETVDRVRPDRRENR